MRSGRPLASASASRCSVKRDSASTRARMQAGCASNAERAACPAPSARPSRPPKPLHPLHRRGRRHPKSRRRTMAWRLSWRPSTWCNFTGTFGVIPGGHRGVWSRWSLATSTTDHTEPPMTKTNMDLSGFLQKHDEGDLLRGIADAVLQLIIEADVNGLIAMGIGIALSIPGSGRAATFRAFSRPARPRSRRWWRSPLSLGPSAHAPTVPMARSRRPGSTVSRPAASMTWCRPWA